MRRAQEGIILYSAAYSLATIGMFAVLVKWMIIPSKDLTAWPKSSLFGTCRHGIPVIPYRYSPTAGFQSKFFMLMAALQNGHHMAGW